jgi:hypothetical protein
VLGYHVLSSGRIVDLVVIFRPRDVSRRALSTLLIAKPDFYVALIGSGVTCVILSSLGGLYRVSMIAEIPLWMGPYDCWGSTIGGRRPTDSTVATNRGYVSSARKVSIKWEPLTMISFCCVSLLAVS